LGDLAVCTGAIRIHGFDVRIPGEQWVLERRMVEQIKNLGAETQTLPFTQPKRLAEGEVDVDLPRAVDAIARRIPKTGGAVGTDSRVWLIGGGVDPIGNLGFEATAI
jgi:hypothetical protein